jgi:hypothetical protein
MSDNEIYPATLAHMQGFGTIIQWFARHETLMACLAAKLLDAHLGPTAFLMAGLGYAGKRDAILSLLKHSSLRADQKEKVESFLEELQGYNRLRNNAAHSVWIEGKRPDSIKPMVVVVKGGSGKVIGLKDNEQDYTPRELLQTADKISFLYNRFRDYLLAEGLLPVIAEKTEVSSPATSALPGSPSAK